MRTIVVAVLGYPAFGRDAVTAPGHFHWDGWLCKADWLVQSFNDSGYGHGLGDRHFCVARGLGRCGLTVLCLVLFS